MLNFQEMIAKLIRYWATQGCIIHQGYDLEVGAGTFNPATFLRCLGPEPYRTVYVEPSRRPQDGRYGENPNRVQSFHQMQVIIKPSPLDLQEIYLKSLESIGFNLNEHDIRFVHDDWENPTIGAWGLGWEVWMDGMEVTQFTYFQSVGGMPVNPVSGEITYGLERLAMFMQKKHSFFDLEWNEHYSYGDLFKRSEWEWSCYNFEQSDAAMWQRHFDDFEAQAKNLAGQELPIPAYDFVMKASHAFNMLDARGVISVTERTNYIGRIRSLAEKIAKSYVASREKQDFPLLNNHKEEIRQINIPPLSRSFNPKEKRDFLFEIGSEELPATFVPIGVHNLKTQISLLLAKEGLSHGTVEVHGTPRRLIVLVKDLACGTETVREERRGPKLEVSFDSDGVLSKAGGGFFKSIGHDPITKKELEKGRSPNLQVKQGYLFATVEKLGKSTKAILAEGLPKLITRIDFPKKMRWGSLTIEYPRPLRWIVALLGKETIPFEIAHLVASNTSFGHRQLDPASFTIPEASDYQKLLKKHEVIADIEERKELILTQLATIEKKHKIKTVAMERVLPQVLHLTEKPSLTLATFDQAFLKAPKQVLISEMVEHQKYFPMSDEKGNLASSFVIVCDNTPNETIRMGNQDALSPRLADGVFLYEEDLKTPLEKLNEKIMTITYQKALGSMYEKVKRMITNVEILHKTLPICDLKKAKRAALLSKADLASHLVGEFPELQGTCGKLYALHHQEDKEVACAIDEHWMPRGEKAPLPKTPTGLLVSMADKIDNLISCFALNLIPTSSSDPYALRRQGLGLFRSMIEQKLSFDLMIIMGRCFDAFVKSQKETAKYGERKGVILLALKGFLLGRLKTIFHELHFEKDEVEAVLSCDHFNVFKSYEMLINLQTFRKEEAFAHVHGTFTRIRKILTNQSSKQGVDKTLIKEDVEKALYAKLVGVKKRGTPLERFRLLGEFKQVVDAFFDGVKVMDDDVGVRTNRLALLFELFELFSQDIDFSKLQIPG